jgi:DNA primase
MEKKDWKKKLRELSFMKGYYFKLEDNGLVEKKDDQLVFNREELERFVQQELDKAREEGRREVYKAIVFDENIPHDITTFVAANLWKNMRDKAKEELSKLKQ